MHKRASRSGQDLTNALVQYTSNFGPSMVDTHARAWGKLCLLDLFGSMLVASSPRYPAGSILEEFVLREGGRPVASFVGRSIRTAPTLAALSNGVLAYYCDNEPHHPASVMHAMAVVVPAALATAEEKGSSGESLLVASVLGIDVACRMSAALDPKALYARGFHPTSVAGTFGAAAACGYLMDLNDQQWRNALGLAGLQASGLLAWANDPTEQSRPLNPGIAARNGLTAASLAALGFGGPAVLEGKFDVFKAFSGVRRADRLTDELGSRLLVTEMAIKSYACCAFLHPGLDGLLALMDENSLTIRDIESIDLHFARAGASVIDNNELKSHNAQYILSVAALRGAVSVDDILGDWLEDEDVARLSHNVRVVHDAELDLLYPERYTSVLVVRTVDGRLLSRRVDWPKGYPQNPLTKEEVMDKFLSMATQRCSREQAIRIADLTLSLEDMTDARELGDVLLVGD